MAGTWYLVLTAGMAAVGIRENRTEAQKETYLPDIANGERNFSIGITEPEAGTNTLNVATRAEKGRRRVRPQRAEGVDHVLGPSGQHDHRHADDPVGGGRPRH